MSENQSMPTLGSVVVVDGEPRSSCCQAELAVQREVGPDVAIYEATEYWGPEGSSPGCLNVSYVKTYDSTDSGGFEVACTKCGQSIEVEVEEM